MPRNPRRARRNRKKKPRARPQRAKVHVPRVLTFSNNIVPKTNKIKLYYHGTFDLSIITGIMHKHSFQVNSLFDPDVTGGGHQPYGRDQWAVLYSRYLVNSCKVTAKFYNNVTGQPHYVGLTLDRDNVLSGNVDTVIEKQKGTKSTILRGNTNAQSNLSLTYNVKTFFDVVQPKDQHQMGAAFGAAPTLPAYLVAWAQIYDAGSTSTQELTCSIALEYDVTLLQPVDLGGS